MRPATWAQRRTADGAEQQVKHNRHRHWTSSTSARPVEIRCGTVAFNSETVCGTVDSEVHWTCWQTAHPDFLEANRLGDQGQARFIHSNFLGWEYSSKQMTASCAYVLTYVITSRKMMCHNNTWPSSYKGSL